MERLGGHLASGHVKPPQKHGTTPLPWIYLHFCEIMIFQYQDLRIL